MKRYLLRYKGTYECILLAKNGVQAAEMALRMLPGDTLVSDVHIEEDRRQIERRARELLPHEVPINRGL